MKHLSIVIAVSNTTNEHILDVIKMMLLLDQKIYSCGLLLESAQIICIAIFKTTTFSFGYLVLVLLSQQEQNIFIAAAADITLAVVVIVGTRTTRTTIKHRN